jgi:hypothetical protein
VAPWHDPRSVAGGGIEAASMNCPAVLCASVCTPVSTR